MSAVIHRKRGRWQLKRSVARRLDGAYRLLREVATASDAAEQKNAARCAAGWIRETLARFATPQATKDRALPVGDHA